jgi:flagellar protein FliS
MSQHMYTSPNSRAASAYKRVNVETAFNPDDKHHVVSMLLDGVVQSLVEARGAMQRGDVVARVKAIGKAVRIIEEGLKPGLDKQDGGDLAQNLEGLYGYCTMRLALANARNDEGIVEEVCRLMADIASAWKDIKSEATATGA